MTSLQNERFIENGDGTVLDRHTGLVWMRCAIGQDWDGKTCKGEAVRCTWTEALEKFANFRYSFAGYNDWRLPDIDELKSLVDRKAGSPTINASAFPNSPASHFWSLTCNVDGISSRFVKADYVNFFNGNMHDASTNYLSHVRLVRREMPTILLGTLPSSRAINKPAIAPVFLSPQNEIARLDKNPSEVDIFNDDEILAKALAKNQATLLGIAEVFERLESLELKFSASQCRMESLLEAQAISRTTVRTAIDLIKQFPESFAAEVNELYSIFRETGQRAITQPNSESILEPNYATLPLLLRGLIELGAISLADLRRHLLPLDLLPSAVIEEINEKAFDLAGDPALEEDGEQVIVFREVLARVLETWDTPSV